MSLRTSLRYLDFFDALRASLTFLQLELKILQMLLYGNQTYDDKTNQIILMDVSQYIKDSKRFDELPFNPS